MLSKYRERLAHRLSKAEIFNKLPLASCIELANVSTERKLSEGEFGCHQGDVWPYIIYVDRGELHWEMLVADGTKHTLFKLHPGDVFWGQSMFHGDPMPASLYADKNSVFYRWHRDTILSIFYQYPDTLWELAGKLTRMVQQTHEDVYGLVFRPLSGRLARLLLEESDNGGKGKTVINFSLEGIASRMSVGVDDVCHVIKHMQQMKLIKISDARINVLDKASLEKLAKLNSSPD